LKPLEDNALQRAAATVVFPGETGKKPKTKTNLNPKRDTQPPPFYQTVLEVSNPAKYPSQKGIHNHKLRVF
jgi:hypothetical protein